METVLTKIIADKKIWVDARKEAQPLASFRHQLTLSDRDFYQALATNKANDIQRPAFILECKKASPSKGLIREDFDLDYIATVYNHYASAISVLTDEKYFQGNVEFLPKVRSQVKQPVLCKDFIIDSYQVYLARHYQADAILLMLSVLDDEQYQALAVVAESLQLGILTEVSNQAELTRAIKLKAKVVGINNRNLRDLSIDLNRTKQLAPDLPKDTIIISESGIYTHQQVRELSPYANGFLIGSSLMAADNLDLAVRKVLFGEHKVCGLTSTEDAHNAYQQGATYGGLIFVPSSPRYISLDQAAAVMAAAPLNFVGVFQDSPLNDVITTATTLALTAVQLHGNESLQYIEQLRQQLPQHCQIWKAHAITDSVPDINQWPVDKHLFDSKVQGQSGGTGVCFDWSLIADNDKENSLLAGGLTPENIAQAASLGFSGLDMNSGVESEPGKKDPHKLAAAFTAIKHIKEDK
ncbi:bifunctional indole-3-glycerol phosphate synthase/phosphoribosylanthranilate isomerase [Photobacterium aquimaris]|uniref:Multifunctional fusion protein n=1 Tax=Photobacterium aquimaris TaxID=512643 RepID=A0A2T3ISQ6_9GAMM|nr:bifunctional indole-3-glycerol-phosphate synthase TrpC/phosphoribosylanthranilate isomerase TrpF [Photobacterium aquimaris]OBU18580.1 bifunctional indole-3-glycerol phosphate synthase/phosphoribosylanthranilate isomerase [Photobacterium aquimaris]OBU21001.1 bifunctional indole-3-glycerol phosphate synthase/phosphoribosylanthranilate isomerase [Photobacterium aquimaris]PSU31392.1 bifunctional indole-3-glycerol-phosphate synthase TrpC/phosphoribosylanthranilate isomerase TrpF [Photobacterium aq